MSKVLYYLQSGLKYYGLWFTCTTLNIPHNFLHLFSFTGWSIIHCFTVKSIDIVCSFYKMKTVSRLLFMSLNFSISLLPLLILFHQILLVQFWVVYESKYLSRSELKYLMELLHVYGYTIACFPVSL